MIALLAALILVWFPVAEPAGHMTTITLRAEHGVLGDVFVLEGDNDNPTPDCGSGRVERTCLVTPGANFYVEWTPYTPRCGYTPRLTATDEAGVIVFERIEPLPDGMSCAYLPGVLR